MVTMDRMQEEYEIWGQDWKPTNGQNHPNSYESFEAGWNAAIEVMLERLEFSKL